MEKVNDILQQEKWEQIIKTAQEVLKNEDSAHNFSHCLRVLKNAFEIAQTEGGEPDIFIAASFLHDICNFPKNHPKRKLSSEYSAQKAAEVMQPLEFDQKIIDATKDAILHHSFSRGSTPKLLESRVFQDADRLDSIGAIGIARTYATGAKFDALLYNLEDPFLKTNRTPDDKLNTLDHFFVKLLKLENLMLTPTGKKLAHERTVFMQTFIKTLKNEII